ncbi:MAG: NAD(P)-dependent glycerol-3-phosphate dehydrogenase [Planctomycetes bacterium]|nr:NAD(P)-dependent glycerol-3-phosphate dehydrogenase [Planctomycetota bacterium]
MPTPYSRVTIVGDGAMGTVCALLLHDLGTEVSLWSAFPSQAEDMRRERENRQFLPGFAIPLSVAIVDDPAEAFTTAPEMILSAVPCQFMRSVWTKLAPFVPKDVPIVSVAKGIETGTLLCPTEIIRACVGPVITACLSGPSIAREVAAKKPASVVSASEDPAVAEQIQKGFSTKYFRVYRSADLLGVELAGASKNVIALAGGICDGIGAGDNAKASLLTRGLVEISRLGVVMGARAETFNGLAGVGDLVTTCISKHSRNRTAGERIGRGETVEEVVASTKSVIEGVATTRAVLALAQRHDVEMPIVEAMAGVLFDKNSPHDAIELLMTRPLHSE